MLIGEGRIPMKILIVDDEHMALEEGEELVLQIRSKAEIICAENYMEALKAAETLHFDIALLDIEMPAQPGITTARHLRNEGNDDVFIIFVTSYPEYMRDSFEVQPFQFITKPVSTSVISKLFAYP